MSVTGHKTKARLQEPECPEATAAVLVIGDEILSGRTQDTNTNYIARFLAALGIDLKEVRVVGDVEDEIVAALNALRGRYDFVFTTGGIGPTHDDITADAVAKAFGVGIGYHPEAYALLEARYPPGEFNDMRKRMARIPHGAALVANSVSGAPGFHIGNVYVMAGVPMVMRAMLEAIAPELPRGRDGAKRHGGGRYPRRRHRARPGPGAEGAQGCRHRLLSLLPRRAAASRSGRNWWCAAATARRWNARPRRWKRCCAILVLHRSG